MGAGTATSRVWRERRVISSAPTVPGPVAISRIRGGSGRGRGSSLRGILLRWTLLWRILLWWRRRGGIGLWPTGEMSQQRVDERNRRDRDGWIKETTTVEVIGCLHIKVGVGLRRCFTRRDGTPCVWRERRVWSEIRK